MVEHAAPFALELTLEPGAAAKAFRRPAIASRVRGSGVSLVWYCAADGSLGEEGLALVVEARRRGAVQRLVRCRPEAGETWLPGRPMPVLAEAPLPDRQPRPGLIAALAEHLVPQSLAAFEGRRSVAQAAGVTVTLLAGTLRAVTAERPVARLTLEGEREAVFALAASLAADLPLAIPATTIAEEARALARGAPPRPLRLGAPAIARGATTEQAFSAIVAHLCLAILANAPAADAGETPEGVHQTRVALRRLRSALSLFRDVGGAEGERASAGLKGLAATLGPARDWDVFITGRLAAVRAAFPEEERIAALARRAEAVREAAYAALRASLDSPGFRLLGLALAELAAAPGAAPEPVEGFAARALNKRLKRVLRHGEDLSGLPIAELHRLRLDCKRLRYAGEMFAPLFGQKKARRFLKSLAAVQEELGHLNDAEVGAVLLEEVGEPGEASAFASGVVEGWIAAKADGAREAAFEAWEEFLGRDVFWDG
ncbi:CHAD domain-containing protein [Elioraea rosea]|uniref:CHAD domain-containing protein n=1 Tax=Elioraea rosea TaxID=2492390 RepID=UPI001181CA8E|nr:CHAD domain-containing protein [Elioraea rosea]